MKKIFSGLGDTYKVASDNGATGWELFGWTLLGIFGGAVIGGAIGAAVGAAAPAIGSFLGSSFTFGGFAFAGGQAAAVTVTGAQIAAGGAALAAGLTVLFSRNKDNNIPMYGEPNSTVGRGHSEGQYDSKGHLIYRKDYATHNGFNPHTHFFKWFLKDGVWRFIKTILPF